jgi:hypothetical protein
VSSVCCGRGGAPRGAPPPRLLDERSARSVTPAGRQRRASGRGRGRRPRGRWRRLVRLPVSDRWGAVGVTGSPRSCSGRRQPIRRSLGKQGPARRITAARWGRCPRRRCAGGSPRSAASALRGSRFGQFRGASVCERREQRLDFVVDRGELGGRRARGVDDHGDARDDRGRCQRGRRASAARASPPRVAGSGYVPLGRPPPRARAGPSSGPTGAARCRQTSRGRASRWRGRSSRPAAR